MHQLSKTDFIHYLNCPKSLWLLKNKPDVYNQYKGELSQFLEKLIKEGYEVEEYAKMLFPKGIDLPEKASPQLTQEKLSSNHNVFFQPSFLSPTGEFARIDILKKEIDGGYHIFEIKSSTSIKKEKKRDPIKDACFQKYVLEECGYLVSKVSIIYLNKEYRKQGKINPQELLIVEEVTEKVKKIFTEVVLNIKSARNFISKESINENECSCRYKTKRNHCDCFRYFNKDMPDYSIYKITRISEKKIRQLLEQNITAMLDIPLDFKCSAQQQLQVESLRREKPMIDKPAIAKTLSSLSFPLHFIDYETYTNAVPQLDGMSPHKHLVFQVSIHTLEENGTLNHYEWLSQKMELPTVMLRQMKEFTGMRGTFISWHASFEVGKNKDMIEWIPKYTTYLEYLNEHMFDLENIFVHDYIDYRFHGYSSIKKVLPVICPQFSYQDLAIQDGTMALTTWGRMVTDPNFKEDIPQTRKNLLAYCELDTLAMVEIYKELRKLEA